MKKTEAIREFLMSNTHRDLAMRYSEDMEVQVNVARCGGDRYEGTYRGKQWFGWTDGVTIWKSYRIPYNAKVNPEYNLQSKQNFDLSKYVEGIGLTGWDWVRKVSKWVAFDFDAMIGHSDTHKHKLSQEELDNIRLAIEDIEWVEIRRSTGGLGLHLYVHLPDVPTNNHNEHAALARAIMSHLSIKASFDFQSKVDICGGNMWVYHRKMLNTNGLQLLKEGTILEDIPMNWSENMQVISGSKQKLVPSFISQPETEEMFTQLSGQRTKTTLDDRHKKLIDWLQTSKARWWWDADNNMLVAHTYDLKKAYEELNFRGIFDTVSTGTQQGQDHNCFGFPLRGGGWVLRRFSPGTKETSNWSLDVKGWTRCYYNIVPDLIIASRHYNGVELSNGGFVFKEAEIAQKVISMVGGEIDIPVYMTNRETVLKQLNDNRVLVAIDRYEKDSDLDGWVNHKDKQWQRVIQMRGSDLIESETTTYDEQTRHLVTEGNTDCGWVVKSDGQWREEPLTHVKHYLRSLGLSSKESDSVIGSSIHKPWVINNLPFKPEYPGNRCWNKTKAQLRFSLVHEDLLVYPTWLKLFTHCGNSLTPSLANNEWAKLNNVTTGAEYLMLWVASMIQFPNEPSPYLFFYGPQGSGKSIFHEAISLLVTGGVTNAGTALDNPNGFNAEIDGSVLCFTEEKDLNRNRVAYNRIKEWVTAKELTIHKKGITPYSVKNTSHWMQLANHREYCPVFPGDERIVVIYVDSIPKENHVPKRELLEKLRKEAPHFTTALLRLEIPKANDRLILPVIVTQDKQEAMDTNKTPLEEFISNKCYHVPGSILPISEFYNEFVNYMVNELQLSNDAISNWSKIKTTRSLPKQFPKGRSTQMSSTHVIGNISFEPSDPIGPELILVGETLRNANSSFRP